MRKSSGFATRGFLNEHEKPRLTLEREVKSSSAESHDTILCLHDVGISGLFGQNEYIPSVRKSLLFYRWATRA